MATAPPRTASRSPRALAALVTALALFIVMAGLVLLSAGSTLGYDYTCYQGAARHLADGQAIYDNGFSTMVGTCPGTYTYPPSFAVALVPWLALGGAANLTWCVSMAACFLVGVALLPLRRETAIAVLVLAAVDWPLLYAIKLGQVEPILFLGFAATWRWSERAGVVGLATAVGALVKVQPGLVAIWALATRRWKAAVLAAAWASALAAVATVFSGPGAWGTYADLLRSLGGTFATPHNYAPGAIAVMAGFPAAAGVVQAVSVVVAVLALLAAWRWTPAVAALQATFVGSQLISAPLRDHYAVLLLLPVAWLIGRGRYWAAVFPLAGWLSLFATADPGTWPAAATVSLTMFACLLAVLVEGLGEAREVRRPPAERVAAPGGRAA